MSVRQLLRLNKLFKLPKHPFNMQQNGEMTYAEWQFQKGRDTIKFYLEYTDENEMFDEKNVLDIGCGAAGKSLYYLSKGATSVIGVDVVEKYGVEAKQLQEKLNLEGFEFMCTDAANMPFAENTFDTVIMNDAMEHVAQPEMVLKEVYRVLKPSGKLYINFPPYNHPFGAHLSDAIGIPWVHLLFNDKTLIDGYKELMKDNPDGKERVSFRIGVNDSGQEYFSYINKMSTKRFKSILKKTTFKCDYYREVPLREFLSPLSKMKIFRDCFTKMVVCVLSK
ncbi:MAG: class I SAM-dependent methyltransferase [Clostridia bacterium]|nr:class I SAM-dependent methyltransferase [Clostridia bacterium]